MTELSFLIELLLHHDLKAETKDLVAERIKEVEQQLNQRIAPPAPIVRSAVAPSHVPPHMAPEEPVAQTVAAANALADRNAAIAAAMLGKGAGSIFKPRPK